MAIKQFFGDFFHKLGQILQAIGSFFSSFFKQETQFFQFFFTLQDTVNKAKQQIDDFKQWTVDAEVLDSWRTRVISVPKVVEEIKNLKDEILDTFGPKLIALRDDVKNFVDGFQQQSQPPVGAEADAGALTNTTLRIQKIVDQLNAIVTLINDLLDFTGEIDTIKKKILGLEGLFLQQKNPRFSLKKKIRARRGKIHAAA
jgi:hypothetical protein